MTVIVVGGGYGGITVAKALDDVTDVVLVEPRDAFVHNVAALRAVVEPEWVERLFIPYDGLLRSGRVVRDRAVRVSATEVEVGDGTVIPADFVVLATGSTSPYPAKLDTDDRRDGAERLRGTHAAVEAAEHVLLLGAGPVGLEFAGEIKAAWPGKAVTVLDPSADIVGGRFPDSFRAELRAQLAEMGVDLLLGSALLAPPPVRAGHVAPFTVSTGNATVAADLWFPCFGTAPNSDYLDPSLTAARQPGGHLDVTPELRLRGHDTVFAVGDVTAVPELKMARLAQMHAEVVATNIRALLSGRTSLTAYTPEPDAIVLPLGPKGGATYASDVGVLGAGPTSDIKQGFYLQMYLELLGATHSS